MTKSITHDHLSPAFDRRLDNIRADCDRFAGLVSVALDGSIESLASLDANKALAVIKADRRINMHARETVMSAATVIALHQPVARDLRLLVGWIQMASHLERLADHAKNSAKRVLLMSKRDLKPMFHSELVALGQLCRVLLGGYLAAAQDADAEAAIKVWHEDEKVDEAFHRIMSKAYRGEHTAPSESLVHSVFIAKNLERTGDMVKNLAEVLCYQLTGENIEDESDEPD